MASVNSNAAPVQAPSLQILPASSSFISSFEYDQAQMRLTTCLKSGAIYQHTFVMPMDWLALQTSQNHSKHWAKNIKGKKLGIRIKSAKAAKSETKHRRK